MSSSPVTAAPPFAAATGRRRWMPQSAILILVLSLACAPSRGSTRPHAESGTLITAEDLAKYPNEPIERVLQRKVPGLVVRRTRDGGLALQIRGAQSYDGSDTRPLYILNDAPIEVTSDGALPGIDPYEIESIKVLKGADAGIYGIRGLNGVIVIATRAARRP
jgi:TonB-dependent SusC/RagA subfamily outer membrane receptor